MPANTTYPPGWFSDPTGRHEYRYWDGSTWTSWVVDEGVTATDAQELPPPPPQPLPSEPSAGATGDHAARPVSVETSRGVGYRASAVSGTRILLVWISCAAALTALIFEIFASVTLMWLIHQGAPSQSTFQRWSWLYHYGPDATAYGYPPIGLGITLLLTAVLLSALLISPLQAVQKAGSKAPLRWVARAEGARLTASLRELGYARWLLRGRGRMALIVISELSAIVVVGISAYTLIARHGIFRGPGTDPGDLSVGLGPVVCLVAGFIALLGSLAAWRWRGDRHVCVLADGSVRMDDISAGAALPAGQSGAPSPPAGPPDAPDSSGPGDAPR